MKFLIAIAALALGALASAPASAAGDIRGKGGKCIDIPDGDTKVGARLHYWPCDGSAEQKWTIENGRIVGKDGMCMNVAGGRPAEGARLQLSACSAPGADLWRPAAGQIRMGDKCLDLPDGNTRDRAPLHLWKCDGSPEQTWLYPQAMSARAAAETALGRLMGVIVYAQECKVTGHDAQMERLGGAADRLQAKLAISTADMEKIAADVRREAGARCEAIRTRFGEIFEGTIAAAEAVQ